VRGSFPGGSTVSIASLARPVNDNLALTHFLTRTFSIAYYSIINPTHMRNRLVSIILSELLLNIEHPNYNIIY
jgi:hypothetical protein